MPTLTSRSVGLGKYSIRGLSLKTTQGEAKVFFC